jgi:pSer/pThr/pTyr-binding forkhead associated (FHA) protein
MSRRHAFLEARDHKGVIQWFLIGSGTNGTFVNGVRVPDGERVALSDGDAIGFGRL